MCVSVKLHCEAQTHPAHYVLSQTPWGNCSLLSTHKPCNVMAVKITRIYDDYTYFPLFIQFASCFFHTSHFNYPSRTPGGRREPLWNWQQFTWAFGYFFIFININTLKFVFLAFIKLHRAHYTQCVYIEYSNLYCYDFYIQYVQLMSMYLLEGSSKCLKRIILYCLCSDVCNPTHIKQGRQLLPDRKVETLKKKLYFHVYTLLDLFPPLFSCLFLISLPP